MKNKVQPLTKVDREKKFQRYKVIVSVQDNPQGGIYKNCFLKDFIHPIAFEKFITLVINKLPGYFTTCRRLHNGQLVAHYVTTFENNPTDSKTQIDKLKEFGRLAGTFDDIYPEEYHLVSEDIRDMFQEKDKEDFIVLQYNMKADKPDVMISPSHQLYRENLEIVKRVKEKVISSLELFPFGYKLSASLSEMSILNAYCSADEHLGRSGYIFGVVIRKNQKEAINLFIEEYEKMKRKYKVVH